ncbi:circadian rna-binding protein chlamy 1 subunit c1 [Nannochloropsis gaditana]|uniref:Circadian rna-binding protein chlamy 1 subunit c1 n=1 Tax=Nannochloropsis gaditana TaxID=72520 RepID=W7TM52_9STRA|nr:circadian rna-binding protein chlamy 1 subunit c1 [Nannochloropsis gaditana]
MVTNGEHTPAEDEVQQEVQGEEQAQEEEVNAEEEDLAVPNGEGGGETESEAVGTKRPREEEDEAKEGEHAEEATAETESTGKVEEGHAVVGQPSKKQATTEARESSAETNAAFAEANQHQEVMDVAKDVVGRIIGKGGETIRDIQTRSGCQCVIDQSVPDGEPRKLTIVGKPEHVKNARAMIEGVMEGGPSVLADFPEVAGNSKATVDCPRGLVGRLIGKGGDIVREIQYKSKAVIQINQSLPQDQPCKVTITGAPKAVQSAREIIIAIMEQGVQALHQYSAGGGSSHAGGGFPSGGSGGGRGRGGGGARLYPVPVDASTWAVEVPKSQWHRP